MKQRQICWPHPFVKSKGCHSQQIWAKVTKLRNYMIVKLLITGKCKDKFRSRESENRNLLITASLLVPLQNPYLGSIKIPQTMTAPPHPSFLPQNHSFPPQSPLFHNPTPSVLAFVLAPMSLKCANIPKYTAHIPEKSWLSWPLLFHIILPRLFMPLLIFYVFKLC